MPLSHRCLVISLTDLKAISSPYKPLQPLPAMMGPVPEFSPALADIYNLSLEQGYFPTQLKQAIVVPVPKLRPPKAVENDLRPISLTSPIAKVLEGFSAKSLISTMFNKLDN